MNYILELLMLISLGGLIAAFQSGMAVWAVVLKAVASLMFVLAGAYGYCRTKRKDSRKISGTMLAALVCSMAGDVFLALDKGQGILFVLGVASFAAAHILFSLSFCILVRVQKSDIAAALLVFTALVLLLLLGKFNFQGLLPLLMGYAAIISFMMVKALSLYRCRKERKAFAWLVMAGGVLFLASDIVLLFWLFGVGMPKEVQSFNWVLYYLAQGCLSTALNYNEIKDEKN